MVGRQAGRPGRPGRQAGQAGRQAGRAGTHAHARTHARRPGRCKRVLLTESHAVSIPDGTVSGSALPHCTHPAMSYRASTTLRCPPYRLTTLPCMRLPSSPRPLCARNTSSPPHSALPVPAPRAAPCAARAHSVLCLPGPVSAGAAQRACPPRGGAGAAHPAPPAVARRARRTRESAQLPRLLVFVPRGTIIRTCLLPLCPFLRPSRYAVTAARCS